MEEEEEEEEVEPEKWLRLYEPPRINPVTHEPYPLSKRQEEAIRHYAADEGYPTLRGFWRVLESKDWTYYDVLREVSPRA